MARQDFGETIFGRDFEKCLKRKRERKRGLLECHKTTIREQKRGLGAGLPCTNDYLQVWLSPALDLEHSSSLRSLPRLWRFVLMVLL